jgi:hypothetical protein
LLAPPQAAAIGMSNASNNHRFIVGLLRIHKTRNGAPEEGPVSRYFSSDARRVEKAGRRTERRALHLDGVAGMAEAAALLAAPAAEAAGSGVAGIGVPPPQATTAPSATMAARTARMVVFFMNVSPTRVRGKPPRLMP